MRIMRCSLSPQGPKFLVHKRVMRVISLAVSLLVISGINYCAFAERDWEYWSQQSFSFPVNKVVTFLVLPEWRFKEDMHSEYSFKLETGPSFKLNKYLDITPYYVYQEKKSQAGWDRSDLIYLDEALTLPLKELFDIAVYNRFRCQYDFDKDKVTLRNSLKISKKYKVSDLELSPYLSEEPFYDTEQNRITEHRTAAGVALKVLKNVSIGFGYMLNSKRAKTKWTYANVLVSNLSIKF